MNAPTLTPRKPVLLIILDGVGVNPCKIHNAVAEAHTPRLDAYLSTHGHTTIEASGRAVGLPPGQMGNSEVGHLTLGAGSIVRQDLVRIDDAIADGSFFTNPVLLDALRLARTRQQPLHLLGLVSDGGVHSHLRHLYALFDACQREGVHPLLHMITDGRDTAPRAAIHYLPELEQRLAAVGGRIATVCGRYYAMDRDRRWERTERAFRAIAFGEGQPATSALAAIEGAYATGESDEFILPRIIGATEPLQAASVCIFFNFRNDRPRQLTAALAMPDCAAFARGAYTAIATTTLTEYDPRFPVTIAFPPERPATSLSRLVSESGIAQFHCAETEKYAHVTFFFNGGREEPFAGEDRAMIPSPSDVPTYDLCPEMSAHAVADATIAAMARQQYGFVLVNFANGDMVGHTAVPPAVIRAVETLDTEVGRVLDAAKAHGYSVVLTADHGNCDEYIDPITGEPHTQHTTYPVMCMVMDQSRWRLNTGGGLADIAPTVLALMGIPQPVHMTGRSLLLEEVPQPKAHG
jgi:2,3-bisphosphoglycerate-independent phosphoglycerate mutase